MTASPKPEPPRPDPRGRLAALIGVPAAAALMATIALWEGKENVGYFDIVGVATACYGDTSGVKVGRRYSDAECAQRLERQALAHVEPVLRCTPRLQGRGGALVAAGSLAYNIGPAAYCRSTVDRRFDAGDFKGACDAFLMWNRAGGREVRRLTRRRQYERQLCLKSL
jgi:lysozyme